MLITTHNNETSEESLLRELTTRINTRFPGLSLRWCTDKYRQDPALFAWRILGSKWWSRQEDIATALLNNRRVAVKSANGVGKTYLAADLALWFLYTHRPSIVITTAPTERQVGSVLWEEIKSRWKNARVKLPGDLYNVKLRAGPKWYAIGIATNQPDRFQGFHHQNMLIIFDEASGVPDSIWDAAEGVAVADNNKILAIGNPLRTEGRFYRIFRDRSAWRKESITALEHPNLTGNGRFIHGCTTLTTLETLISDWCEPIESSKEDFVTPAREFHSLRPAGKGPPGNGPPNQTYSPPATESAPGFDARGDPTPDTLNPTPAPDIFVYKGRRYKPNNLFRARILAMFPDAGDESLIPIRWIEASTSDKRHLPSAGYPRAAVDVARFGDDDTVIALRCGPVVEPFSVVHGHNTMAIAQKIKILAFEHHPHSIAVDSIGIGAGVVDRLRQMGIEGVIPVNVAKAAFDSEQYANRRAELYWGIRERFHEGTIVIPNDEKLVEELASIRYFINSKGQIQIESKDQMKRRLGGSPDRADALAMLMDNSSDWVDASEVEYIPHGGRMG